ncbi:MAG TPA: PEP-CTERM sorting domain-containing protein [Alphaproteobacteria bacterium]|nr:PEP-CTERM sorting domain-containing protein [Alphaproteobacteria bacterium]
MGGQNLPYSTLSTGPNYTVYGANIPAALDGQMETLDLFLNGGQSLLDNIEFSPLSVPEPSEWALIGIGTILLGIRRFSEMTQIEKRQKTNLRFRVGSA